MEEKKGPLLDNPLTFGQRVSETKGFITILLIVSRERIFQKSDKESSMKIFVLRNQK